jgi:hypothetical protein
LVFPVDYATGAGSHPSGWLRDRPTPGVDSPGRTGRSAIDQCPGKRQGLREPLSVALASDTVSALPQDPLKGSTASFDRQIVANLLEKRTKGDSPNLRPSALICG